MKTRKILLGLLMLILLVNTVGAVVIDDSFLMLAHGFTLQTTPAGTDYTYTSLSSDGLTYWNLDGSNVTFVSHVNTTKTLIERDGHYGYGNYSTTISFDVYKTSSWSIDALYVRVYAGDNSLAHNYTSGYAMTPLDSSHNHYTLLFKPSDLIPTLSASQMGAFDVNIYARAHNATLHYYGNITSKDLFSVYILDHPYHVSTYYNTTWHSINITWGATTPATNHSDRTVIIRRNDTYATSPYDTHSYIVYNGTGTHYNATSVYDTRYYMIFNYNRTSHSWASSIIEWGALIIWNVYNETEMEQAIWYNIQISNYNGSITYVANDVHAPLTVDFASIPFGDNTIFVVSNDTNLYYKKSIYYKNLEKNHFYNYTFYLAPLFVPGGGSTPGSNDTYSYVITVVGQQFEYGTSPPIEGSLVTITRYNNVTGTYVEVRSLLSGANGECAPVYLITGVLYKFIVTKDGYTTSINDYIPDPTASRTILLRIIPVTIIIPNIPKFSDYITFTAVMLFNNTIVVNYTDINMTTENTHIYVYEMYNNTQTLIYTSNEDHNYNFQFYVGVNTSRTYLVTLFFNNTIEYDITSPYSITVYPLGTHGTVDLEQRFTSIFGELGLGWCSVISVSIAIVLLVSFGPFNTGFGVIAAGFGLLGTQALFLKFSSNTFNPVLGLLGGFVIAIGIIYMWTKGNGDNL